MQINEYHHVLKENHEVVKRSKAQKVWLFFGALIILFSAIFLIPPILMSLRGDPRLGAYINQTFIPFLYTLLLIFIVLVVVYIWWHMINQETLVDRLDAIEEKLDKYHEN
jgi:hypothetical protein